MLGWILGVTFSISFLAFVGALTLFFTRRLLQRILFLLVAFSAGTLLGSAFLHLLPEALAHAAEIHIFLSLLAGFCFFFVLEQFIRWHHHHVAQCRIKPFSYLILVGDALHNFVDGLIVAASFLFSFPLGVTTSLAIALHEIPQEIGDFGVLVYSGFRRIKALLLNYLSAIFVVVGGLVGFFIAGLVKESMLVLLPFAAGNFLYVASSDLLPELKHQAVRKSLLSFLVFLTGIGVMLLLRTIH